MNISPWRGIVNSVYNPLCEYLPGKRESSTTSTNSIYSACPTIILWKEEDSTPLLQKNYRSIYRLTFSCEEFSTTLFAWTTSHCLWGTFETEARSPRSLHLRSLFTALNFLLPTSTLSTNAESSHWSESTTYVTLSKVKSQDTQVSKSSRQPRSNKLKNQNHRSEELTTPKLPLVTTHHLN